MLMMIMIKIKIIFVSSICSFGNTIFKRCPLQTSKIANTLQAKLLLLN